MNSPIHWPGVHCAKALITGGQIEGTWFDRKLEYKARLQGKEPGPREFASTESVVQSQLPCWRHLEPKAYRSRMAELVREIEETAAAERREIGKEPLAEEGVRAQDPETRPRKIKKSPAPFVHAATKSARKAMWEAYGWFVAAFRGGGEAEGGRPERGLPGWELPARAAVRGGLRRRNAAAAGLADRRLTRTHRSVGAEDGGSRGGVMSARGYGLARIEPEGEQGEGDGTCCR